jgi:hypothetical protein
VVQRLAPRPGGGDGDVQIALDLLLADEIAEMPRPQAVVQSGIGAFGFRGNDTFYFSTAIPRKYVAVL